MILLVGLSVAMELWVLKCADLSSVALDRSANLRVYFCINLHNLGERDAISECS